MERNQNTSVTSGGSDSEVAGITSIKSKSDQVESSRLLIVFRIHRPEAQTRRHVRRSAGKIQKGRTILPDRSQPPCRILQVALVV